jgi:transcriptional regulator
MHIQKHFEETRTEEMHHLIDAHPLATLIVTVDGELVVNHIPMLLDSGDGQHGMLRAHISKANPLFMHLQRGINAVAIFRGAQTYISPNWYPSKHVDGKQVPTWNYVVVHAHGKPRLIDDSSWLLTHLHAMTNKQEASLPQPWKVSDAPREFIDRMMTAIIGIEMPIVKLEGKWKVSQNRTRADQFGVAAGLQNQGNAQSQVMTSLVMQRLKPTST